MRFIHFIIGCLLLGATTAFAQPVNDECTGAFNIPNVVNYCSNFGEFTNQQATPSGFPAPLCFANVSNDVWFSFTAVATDVNINVIGASSGSPGGNMIRPEVALYSGNCSGTINSQECEADITGFNIVELYKGGLTIGETYYIRIDNFPPSTGTFQLCINNYNPPVEPGADCFSAAILCDKSPFVIQSVVGAGANPNEALGTCLDVGGGLSESNSTWFVWTAATNGSLSFVLTPNNSVDDLDFVVYRLPGGLTDCGNKQVLRCMASGADPALFPTSCHGPTGLRPTSADTEEQAGCDPGDDNFVSPINMVAGNSYALLINNFTSTGNGFSIEFGGTGEFQGPEPAIASTPPNSVCWGESITFNDNSTQGVSPIVGWEWNFGLNAVPQTGTGTGPHIVSYTTPGTKFVTLTIESSLGCLTTETTTIFVDPCCFPIDVAVTQQDLDCPDDMDGAFDLTVTGNNPPFNFEWSTGAVTEDINGLGLGDYMVTISDFYGCDTVMTLTVGSPPPFDLATILTMPTCDGGMDGSIELVVTGAMPPYQYNWNGTGFTTSSDLLNIGVSINTVVIQDANGCETTRTFDVRELELELDPNIQLVTEPSCNGNSDGSVTVNIINGLPPYTYDWNDGNGFVSSNTLNNVPAGTYGVTARDANGCLGSFSPIDVGEPDPLGVSAIAVDVSCFGDTDGLATAIATGGTPSYTYSWNNPPGQNSASISNLGPGIYSVTVIDANGCTASDFDQLDEPAPVDITDIQVVDNECFGGAGGALTITAEGGNRPFEYSADGITFQSDSVLTDLLAGTYTVVVRDVFGCDFEAQATITEPFEIIVDARYDQTIDLGYSADLQAIINTSDQHTYTWTPSETLSCSDCFEPTAMPFVTTTYYVTVETYKGCTAMDSVTVTVNPVRPVFIPNAFSPNADGTNDSFLVFGSPAVGQVNKLDVYSRWGNHVFRATDIPVNDESFGWDGKFNGKPMNPGVYVYYAEVQFLDGVVETYKGDVTIVK